MTEETILTGLDGANPLAFLAALGTLDAAAGSSTDIRLSWRNLGRWRAVLHGALDRDALLDAIVADAVRWRGEGVLALEYAKEKGGKKARDLKPQPAIAHAFLREQVAAIERRGGPFDAVRRTTVDMLAALLTDVVEDNNGNIKPTALHFTAGQQEFLAMVNELVDGVTREHIEEALFGPWRYQDALPVLAWDATANRDYALRASDPSKEKKLGVAGAEWLAFRGLRFVPVAPVGDRVETAGCSGGWKTGVFQWPMWGVPLTRAACRVVVPMSDLEDMDGRARAARGIEQVFRSLIRRSAQGGYGSFLPSEAVAPRASGQHRGSPP